jgi:hypothetical protein
MISPLINPPMMSKHHLLSPQKKSSPKAARRAPVALEPASGHQVQMRQIRQHMALDLILQLLNTQLHKSSESREERIIQW